MNSFTYFIDRKQELQTLQRSLSRYPLAVLEGLHGSGKTWLALRAGVELGFEDSQIYQLDLNHDGSPYAVWTGLAGFLKEQGYTDLQNYLDGAGTAPEMLALLLERGLREVAVLIILDHVEAMDWARDATGWKAILRRALVTQFAQGGRSLCLLLSRVDVRTGLAKLDLDATHYAYLEVPSLPFEAVRLLAQGLGIDLSADEERAVYDKTGGHALLTRLTLEYLSGLAAPERLAFLRETPGYLGHTDPGDPAVQYVQRMVAGLTPAEQDLLLKMSLLRMPQTAPDLSRLLGIENSGIMLGDLEKRGLVEYRARRYGLPTMLRHYFHGVYQASKPDEVVQEHRRLAEAFTTQGHLVEALYHWRSAGANDKVVEVLHGLNLHELSVRDLDVLLRSVDQIWLDPKILADQRWMLNIQAGQAAERLGLYESAVTYYQQSLRVTGVTPVQQAEEQRHLAWAYHRLRRAQESERALRQAETVLRRAAEVTDRDWLLLYTIRGRILAERDQLEAARETLNQALSRVEATAEADTEALQELCVRQPEFTLPLAETFHALGRAYAVQQPLVARSYFERAAALYDQAKDRWRRGVTWVNIYWTYAAVGNREGMKRAKKQALAIADELDDHVYIRPLLVVNDAIRRFEDGEDWAGAERDFLLAKERLAVSGLWPYMPPLLHQLGVLYSYSGQWEKAEETFREKLDLSERLQDAYEVSTTYFVQAEMDLLKVEAGLITAETATARVEIAVQKLQELNDPSELVSGLILSAEHALLKNDLQTAQAQITAAEQHYQEVDQDDRSPVVTGKLYEVQVRILAQHGQSNEARGKFAAAMKEQVHVFLREHTRYHYALALLRIGERQDALVQLRAASTQFKHLPVEWLFEKAERVIERNSSWPEIADCEVRIFARTEAGYRVEMLLNGEQEISGITSAVDLIHAGDSREDGENLFNTLFADERLRAAWIEARERSLQCRLRLRIDPLELRGKPWELMHDANNFLAADAKTPVSRYLPVDKPWGRPIAERPVRVLAVISNPSDLNEKYTLPQADVDQEISTLKRVLLELGQKVHLDFLDEPITLEKMETRLRNGYHILHFIGHGAFNVKKQQAALYLQNEDGTSRRALDSDIAGMLARLKSPPHLIVLSACQSAQQTEAEAFSGLSPKLIEISVPAVVAMQDNVSVLTARQFTSTFYRRLLEHGQVDRAMNEARSTLITNGRYDVAAPVLFMRLKDGRLWDFSIGSAYFVELTAQDVKPPSQSLEILFRISRRQFSSTAGLIRVSGKQPVVQLDATGFQLYSERVFPVILSQSEKSDVVIEKRIQGRILPGIGEYEITATLIDHDGQSQKMTSLTGLRPSRRDDEPRALTKLPGQRREKLPDLITGVYAITSPHGKTPLQLAYVCYSPHKRFNLPGTRQGTVSVSQAKLHWLQSELANIAAISSHTAPASLKMRLAQVGRWLYKNIFSAELRALYQKLGSEIRTWQFMSEIEPWIPWELIKPYTNSEEDEFLGTHLAVARWLEGLGAPIQYEFPVGPVSLTLDNRLAQLCQPEEWLKTFSPGVIPQRQTPLLSEHEDGYLAAIQYASPIWGLHFEGLPDLLAQRVGALMVVDTEPAFSQEAVDKVFFDFWKKHPVVTYGMVRLDDGQSALSAMESNWVPTFIKAGVGAFIGTLWATDPRVDRLFWSVFYQSIWERMPLGEAALRARQAVRAAIPDTMDWLAYFVVGDSQARAYVPAESEGYARLECSSHDLEQPMRVDEKYNFVAHLDHTPSFSYSGRRYKIAPDAIQNPRLIVYAPGFEVEAEGTIDFERYGGSFSRQFYICPRLPGKSDLLFQFFDGDEMLQTLGITVEVKGRRK